MDNLVKINRRHQLLQAIIQKHVLIIVTAYA